MSRETPTSRPEQVDPDATLQDVGVDEGGATGPVTAPDAGAPPVAEPDAATPEAAQDSQTPPDPDAVTAEPDTTTPETDAATTEPDGTTPEPEPEPATAEPDEATAEPVASETTPAQASALPLPRPVPRPSAGPRPAPRPGVGPRPGSAGPRPAPRPGDRPQPPAPRPAPTEAWGRVDNDGTVSVREATGWRVVGQYPDGTPAEALAYYERKFADLAAEVRLLEDRQGAGASAGDLRAAADTIRTRLVDAAAVGDLATLLVRIDVVDGTLSERREAESAAAREAVDAATAERTVLVERIEALAQRDPATIHWKQTTADVTGLFDEWQRQQKDGPRLPKSASQQLWKRFRDARSTLDRARREFYADLDAVHKTARDAKTHLVEQAEALAPRGEDGIGTYRDLLERWKSAGRAGKKADDALWVRFKAAGDALYSARGDREAAEAEASKERIATRRALLAEAAAVAAERDIPKARSLLTGIQRRWDDTGRIFPRETERALDDDLRKIENALRHREDADWKSNDPTTRARADDMTRQLEEAIAKLEADVAAAKASGDKAAEKRAAEALSARRSWLGVVGR